MNTEDIGDLLGMYDGNDGPTNEPDWEEERFQILYEEDGEWYEAIGESLTAEEVADALPDLIEEFGCVKVREA